MEDATVAALEAAHELIETIPLVMRTLAADLRRSGHLLMPAHLATLVILEERDHNLSELAERLVVSRPTGSNLITNLQQRGWVRRERSVRDRRRVVISLTPAGRAILAELQQDAQASVARRLAPLTEGDCARLRAGLEILRDLFPLAASASPRE